jgi:hypothetical protein
MIIIPHGITHTRDITLSLLPGIAHRAPTQFQTKHTPLKTSIPPFCARFVVVLIFICDFCLCPLIIYALVCPLSIMLQHKD